MSHVIATGTSRHRAGSRRMGSFATNILGLEIEPDRPTSSSICVWMSGVADLG